MILRTLIEGRGSLENPSVKINGASLLEAFGATPAWTGQTISTNDSMAISAAYACISLIAGAVGTLPTHVFKDQDDARIKASGHPLARLLTREPNEEQTSAEFWELIAAWQLIYGQGYAYPVRDTNGRVQALWPVDPRRVKKGRSPRGRRVYEVRLADGDWAGPAFKTEEATLLLDHELWEFPSFLGISLLQLGRQTFAAAKAAEEYGARFFAHDASAGGFLKAETALSDEVYERVVRRWKDAHQGVKNAHQVALLEGGLDWKGTSFSNQDAQFLETRKFSVAEIARYFRVPPHMIGDVERSTSWGSGIEQQSIGFVKFSLIDRLVRIEQVVNKYGLRTGFYMKFSTAGLERGDIKTRYESYAIGRQWGFLSTNDIRALEDLPPVDDGDIYLQPLNMVEAGAEPPPPPEPTPPPQEEEETPDEDVERAFAGILEARNGL